MCVQRANRREPGPRGTHAGFPNVMMKRPGRTLTSRMTRFHDQLPPRLAFKPNWNPLRAIENFPGREDSRGRKGRGRFDDGWGQQDRGNRKLCSSIIGVPPSCTVNQRFCCYPVVNLAEEGEKRRWLILWEHFARKIERGSRCAIFRPIITDYINLTIYPFFNSILFFSFKLIIVTFFTVLLFFRDVSGWNKKKKKKNVLTSSR